MKVKKDFKVLCKFINKIKKLNLEDQLFVILLCFSIVLSIMNVIINIAINFRFDANYKWFVMFLSACIAIYYHLIKGKNSKMIKNIIFFEIVYFFLPNGWLLTRGSSYATMAYLYLITILISLVLESRARLFFITSEVLIVMALLYYDYRQSFQVLKTDTIVFKLDALIQIPIALLASAFILTLFANAYRKEEKQLSEYSQLLEEKNQALTQITITDELTGLYNRRYIFQKLKEIKEHLDLVQYQVRVAVIDIDNFKTINDAYGHIVGDQVLKAVSATMQKIVSENGYVGRYGGDEFVIILNNTTYLESKLIFDCLTQEIQDIKAFEDFIVTVSGGLSRFYPGDNIDEVLNRADKMLYEAKHKSKNHIVLESQES